MKIADKHGTSVDEWFCYLWLEERSWEPHECSSDMSSFFSLGRCIYFGKELVTKQSWTVSLFVINYVDVLAGRRGRALKVVCSQQD